MSTRRALILSLGSLAGAAAVTCDHPPNADHDRQRRRQLIAWAFNLLILILACGWLLLNLLINPERYAGSLSVAGMTDDEWRRTIIITALSSLPTSFLLIDGLKCTIRRSPSGSPASPLPRGVHVVSEQGARRSPTRRHRR